MPDQRRQRAVAVSTLRVAIVGTGSMAMLLYAKLLSAGMKDVYLFSTTSNREDLAGARLHIEDCRPVATESSRRALTVLTLPKVYDVKSIPGFMESVHVLRNRRKHAPIGLPDVFCSSLQWAGIVASFDVVFLAGAAYQVVEATAAAALLARKHDPRAEESRSGLIVSLYNGGFTLEFISRGLRMLQVPGHAPLGAFSPSLVYATTAHGAGVGQGEEKGLFRLRHTGEGPTVLVPLFLRPDVSSLMELLTSAGFANLSQLEPRALHAARWSKLAVNAIINPLTAIFNVPNGAIASALLAPACDASASELRAAADELMVEVATAMVSGTPSLRPVDMNAIPGWYPWSPDTAHSTLRTRVIEAARATAANSSSMRSAIMSGRPSEVEFILGWIDRSWLHESWYPAFARKTLASASAAPSTAISKALARVLYLELKIGGRVDPSSIAKTDNARLAASVWHGARHICEFASGEIIKVHRESTAETL